MNNNENELHYSVLKSSCYQLLDSVIKNKVCHLKKSMCLNLTLVMSPKVKLTA